MLRLGVFLLCGAAFALASDAHGSSTFPDSFTIPGPSGYSLDVKLDSSGYPIVAYFNSTEANILHCDDPNCASGGEIVTVIETVDGANTQLNGRPMLELGAGGNPTVAYVTYNSGPSEFDLRIFHCGNPSCTAGNTLNTAVVEPVAAPYLFHLSLALDNAGNPILAYASPLSQVKVLHCDDPACAGLESAVTVDTGGPVDVAADSAGNPVLAYGGVLRLLHCNDAYCAGGDDVPSMPVGNNSVRAISLLLDSSGNPAISYYSGGLALLRCNDPDCSGGDDLANLASAAQVDDQTELALSSTDVPVIAYDVRASSTEYTHRMILARCADPACSSTTSVTVGLSLASSLAIQLDVADRPVIAYGPSFVVVVHCGALLCADNDADGDQCPDLIEFSPAYYTVVLGGFRNPKNSYDYFNPSHDGLNRVDDILLVVQAYFKDAYLDPPTNSIPNPAYNPDFDRVLPMGAPYPWSLQAGNGLQRIDDILNQIHQYRHDCS